MMSELKSRKFEAQEWEVPLTGEGRDPRKVTIWMIEEFEATEETDVARLSTPLVTIHRNENVNSQAIVDGVLSMFTIFGLPDGTKRFVEHVDATPYETDSITGR